jgi:hypothetical protein
MKEKGQTAQHPHCLNATPTLFQPLTQGTLPTVRCNSARHCLQECSHGLHAELELPDVKEQGWSVHFEYGLALYLHKLVDAD